MFGRPVVTDAENARRPFLTPWVSLFVIGICVIEFLILALNDEPLSWESWVPFGYLPPSRIRSGALWALISTAFIHQNFLHLAFNVFWIWELGSRIERHLGTLTYSVFFVSAAFVSSSAELAVTDSTGIGASGVVYAMFGFMWVSRNRSVDFQTRLDRSTTQLFVIWLFARILINELGGLKIGNTAHFSGLIFGALVSAVFEVHYRLRLTRAALILLITVSVVPLMWCPWSVSWLTERAYAAHASQGFPAALRVLSRTCEGFRGGGATSDRRGGRTM